MVGRETEVRMRGRLGRVREIYVHRKSSTRKQKEKINEQNKK
jgi:hypothetical protein